MRIKLLDADSSCCSLTRSTNLKAVKLRQTHAGEALRAFRCCLLSGKQFNLVTDNRPNTFLQTQPILSRRQARWSEYLQGFDFNWMHRAGRHNVAESDPLSRNPNFKHLNAILADSTRGSTSKRSVQEVHTASDTTASQAGQKRRKGASSPVTGADTIPLNIADKQHPAASPQPMSKDGQSAAIQPQSSSSESADALHDVSMIDNLAEAYTADPFFADEAKTADLTIALGLWWKRGLILWTPRG